MDLLTRIKLHWDRAAAITATVVGAVALLLGWIGTSHSEFAAEQIPYLVSGGLGGIFLLGLAGLLWLSADLRDEWLKLDALEDHLESIENLLSELKPTITPAPVDSHIPSAATSTRGRRTLRAAAEKS